MFLLDLVLQTPGALAPLIWGEPGVAKTAVMKALAEKLGWYRETIITSIRQPEDFGGIKIPHETEGVKVLADAWVNRILKAVASEKFDKALAFADEVSCAAPATQAALLRPVLEGWVGDEYLDPEKVKWAAAANPPDIAAGGWDMSYPLANRWTHIEWPNPTAMEWADFMAGGPGVMPEFVVIDPVKWAEAYERAKILVGAFFRKADHEKYLNELKDVIANDTARFPMAYGSPRTWENATRLLATVLVMEESGNKNAVRRAAESKIKLVAGSVGQPGAMAMFTWLEEANLPDPEELLADPSKWKPVRSREDVLYAVCNGVGAAAIKPQASAKQYKTRWTTAWEILGKCLPISRGLVAVSARKLAAKANRPKGALLDKKVVAVANELKDVLKATGFFENE